MRMAWQVRLMSVAGRGCHQAMTLFFFATIVTFSYVSSLPVFSGNKQLERLIVHPQTGDVYVAAVNRLYQLTSDLQPKGQEYKTGPKHTDGQCFPPEWKRPSQSDSLFCSSKDDLVDFHNQVFLLNLTGSVITDTVIVCGNAYSGECNFHSAENITSITISSKNIFDDANKLNRPILASQYQPTLSTSAVTSTLQNNEAALFVASVTPSSTVLTHSVMKVVKLNATDLLALLGEQALARWNEKERTDRPRQGFKSGQFVYFASYQMVTRDSTSKYMTVLSRICTNDLGLGDDPPTILAYMEGSIKCGNFDYMTSQTVVRPGTMLQTALQLNAMEDILIASFAQDYNSGLDSVSGKSAICIFKMSEIEQQFKNTQESCRLGDATVKKGLQREGTNNGACIDISSVWDGKSCSPTNKINFVLEAMSPITSQPVYELRSRLITTVAATVVGEMTILFVGTNKGNIIKLQLDSRTSIIRLSNSPVVELTSRKILSISFSHDNGSLLVMSKSEVVKVPIHSCAMLTSCHECVNSNDHVCGFCVLENKCSSQEDCLESTDRHRWLQSNSSQCITFHQIGPLIVSVATPKLISLQVSNVPMSGSFECVFGEQGSTVATRSGTGQSTFSCQTPQPSSLPGLGDSLTVSVSLKSTSTGVHFVHDITTLTLFDCDVHTTCSACTAAALPCGWCLSDGLCTDTSYDCRIDDYWKEGTVNECFRSQTEKNTACNASSIYYDVSISTARENHTVLLNQDIVIQCGNWKVTGEMVKWSHNGRTITSKSKIATDGSLYLASFGVFDSGTFQCYVNYQLLFQTTIQAIDPPGFMQPELVDIADRAIGFPIVANASDDVRILCKPSGYPKPSIAWSMNGRLLPSSVYSHVSIKDDDTLVIKNTQMSDSGTYSCTASNVAGSNSAQSVVDIQYHQSKPRIARRAHRQIKLKHKKWLAFVGAQRAYVRHKSTLFVECEVNGAPVPTVSWEKGGVPVGKSGLVRVNKKGQLRIGRADEHDMGSYTCVARNNMGSDQETIELVHEELPKIHLYANGKRIRDQKLSVLEGSETEVCCSVVGSHSDADVQWLHLKSPNKSKQCVTIRGTKDSTTAGKYSCRGQNVVGSSTTVINVNIEQLSFVTRPNEGISIDTLPVEASPNGVELSRNSDLTIQCRAISSPNIVWQKDGYPLSLLNGTISDETLQEITTSTLSIRDVKMPDTGLYSCIISNGVITKNSSVAVAVGGHPIMWDSESPVIKDKNVIRSNGGVDVKSLVDDTIIFDCPVVNTEPVSVVWTKNGNSFLGTNVEVVNYRTLIINNASILNEGEFTCQATNQVGSARKRLNLQVHDKPKMWLNNVKSVNNKYEYNVDVNKEVRILCGGDGYPFPRFTWKAGRRAMLGSGRASSIVHSGMAELVISNTTIDDAMTYVCEAENAAGSERLEVQVFVQAGDLAFNFSIPDINSAVKRLKLTGFPNENEGLRWTEIDSSGRLTNYEPSDSWFEETEESTQLKSQEAREREPNHYVDASVLRERVHCSNRQSRAVVGDKDDRVEIDDTTRWPYRTSGIIIFSKRGSSTTMPCTGTLINKRHVLTAGHCISDGDGKFYRNLVFYPAANAKNPDMPYPYGKFNWKKLYTARGYHKGGHLAFDYGLILLTKSVEQYMAFQRTMFTSNSGNTMAASQYPRDRQHGQDYTMWHSTCPVGSPLIAESDLIYGHTCDTSDGSSGSGLYLSYSNDLAVMLVHTGIGDRTLNRAVAITTSKFLQLCHWIKNSGGVVEPNSACDVDTKRGDTAQTKN